MKNLALTISAIIIATSISAQVEMKKTKQTLMGKKSLIAADKTKYTIDNFGISFVLYAFAEDQGGSSNVALSSKVGVRTDLTGIDSAICQAITDEAYAYYVEQWKKRSIELYNPTIKEIEASKKYSKAMKKGKKHSIISGGTHEEHTKKKHTISAWPNGVNISFSGKGPMAANGNFGNLFLDATMGGHYASFGSTIEYISFKTAKLGSVASVKTFPRLKASNSMTAQTWKKGKVGNYIGSNVALGIEDFYTERKDKEISVLNTNQNMWNYVADVAKYKANVLAMIKKGMDDMFADYDRIVAENKK